MVYFCGFRVNLLDYSNYIGKIIKVIFLLIVEIIFDIKKWYLFYR